MPGPRSTLQVEGTFKELIEELADYLDNLKKSTQSDAVPGTVKTDVTPLLENYTQAEESQDEDALDDARDEVLNVVVPASSILNTAPDREFIPAHNLLIYLVRQSDNVAKYLQSICQNLSSTSTSTTPTKLSASLTILSTVFNTADPDDSIRFPVFSAILDVVARSGQYESIRSQLAHLDGWLAQWGAAPARQRSLYLKVAKLAGDAGESEEAYEYLIRALRTVPSADVSSDEARKLSLQALKAALNSPTHYDFEDLTSLDSIQALRNSDAAAFELLDIFTANALEDYVAFKNENGSFIEETGLDDAVLTRKIRLLTLASLASSGTTAQTRALPYTAIASGLQIPDSEVEMWVIDVIRAGLVEGKLSQSTQTFLIHRSTYRVFGESQWREVAGRLDMWRESLIGVLNVVRAEKESMVQQKEQELRAAEMKVNGFNASGGYRRAAQRDVDGLD